MPSFPILAPSSQLFSAVLFWQPLLQSWTIISHNAGMVHTNKHLFPSIFQKSKYSFAMLQVLFEKKSIYIYAQYQLPFHNILYKDFALLSILNMISDVSNVFLKSLNSPHVWQLFLIWALFFLLFFFLPYEGHFIGEHWLYMVPLMDLSWKKVEAVIGPYL